MIYLSPPHLNPKANFYLQEALDTNWVAPVGKNLDEFEHAICEYTQAKYALATISGTSAIHLALRLLGVKEGDYVICPSLTFVASVNPVFYQNATPILIDSEEITWNICPKYLEKALDFCKKNNKKVSAIIVVHLYGQPAQMREIKQIADFYGVPIVEDSAEALGSKYKEQYAGTLGDLGIFSFNGNKIITTSGGGMLITNTQEQREKALFLATQAKDNFAYYHHSEIGYNYRLSNVLAGLGRGQMEVLDERINKKREIFDFYVENLSLKDEKIKFQTEIKNTFSNRWLSAGLFSDNIIRDKVLENLKKNQIEARFLWKPLHIMPLFMPLFKDILFFGENNYKNTKKSISEYLFERGLCLPSGTAMTKENLEEIVEMINDEC